MSTNQSDLLLHIGSVFTESGNLNSPAEYFNPNISFDAEKNSIGNFLSGKNRFLFDIVIPFDKNLIYLLVKSMAERQGSINIPLAHEIPHTLRCKSAIYPPSEKRPNHFLIDIYKGHPVTGDLRNVFVNGKRKPPALIYTVKKIFFGDTYTEILSLYNNFDLFVKNSF